MELSGTPSGTRSERAALAVIRVARAASSTARASWCAGTSVGATGAMVDSTAHLVTAIGIPFGDGSGGLGLDANLRRRRRTVDHTRAPGVWFAEVGAAITPATVAVVLAPGHTERAGLRRRALGVRATADSGQDATELDADRFVVRAASGVAVENRAVTAALRRVAQSIAIRRAIVRVRAAVANVRCTAGQ